MLDILPDDEELCASSYEWLWTLYEHLNVRRGCADPGCRT